MSAAAKAISNRMPQSRSGLRGTPTERSDARSVRDANAVPIWHATMPANVMVVALT